MVLAAGGVRQELIAKVVGISVPTLEKAYRSELDIGKARITAQAIACLVKTMQGGGRGAVAAAAFWLKCREGWKEISGLEITDLQKVRNWMKDQPDDEE